MGDRSSIVIKSATFDADVVLYGHWSGDHNLEAVKCALEAGHARIGDANYLAAQIFFQFAIEFGGYDGNLSFGISAHRDTTDLDFAFEDNSPVYVDADFGTYTYQGIEYDRNGDRL